MTAPVAKVGSPWTRFAPQSARLRHALTAAALFLVVLGVYLPALRGGFIWNDEDYVTRDALRSLGGLVRIWIEPGATEQYYPVLHSFFWLQHLLWGDAALGYHLVGVLLHATAACLFAAVLRHLALPGAWLAAFLFALHPVSVESVAWIAEQKNTLSLVLYLAAGLAYLRYDGVRSRTAYRIALGLFIVALGAKSLTATLPAALLVVRWWQAGKIDWRRDVVPLLPWFVLGALFGLFTAWVERHLLVAQGAAFALGLVERCLLAARVVFFYLGKLFWPADLIFIYPRWQIQRTDPALIVYPIALFAVLAVLWGIRRRWRGPLAAFLFFIGSLFPVMGFFNLYAFIYSYVADHWQYLPQLGILAAVAAGATRLATLAPPRFRLVGPVVALGVCGLLAGLSWRQAGMYRDIVTFYQTTLARNPACWMAHNNLGIELVARKQLPEAMAHYRQAVALNPGYADGINNLGQALLQLGQTEAAAAEFHRALALAPDHAKARYNLGVIDLAQGRTEAAVRHFQEAARSLPDFPDAEANLGVALGQLGRKEEALVHYARALREQPNHAPALYNMGNTLLGLGRAEEAIKAYERAARADPSLAAVHVNWGSALGRLGRGAEAIKHYEIAVQLRPELAEAHYALALALKAAGRGDEARSHYETARRLQPALPAVVGW